MIDHPTLAVVVWVGAQIVAGVLGYVQGRKDENLKWLQIMHREYLRYLEKGGSQ